MKGGDKNTSPRMGTSIERLRALQHTAHGMNKLIKANNSFGAFSSVDKLLMESFKKIFHLGSKQLSRFFEDFSGKLKYGSAISPYDQLYYKTQLLNSPFRGKVIAKVVNKERYWRNKTDIMGITGDINNRASSETPIYDYWTGRSDVSSVTRTKMPGFMQANINILQTTATGLVTQGVFGSIFIDNTLPLIDKSPINRYNTEANGGLQGTAHGHRMVCDSPRYAVTRSLEEYILGSDNEEPYDEREYNTGDKDTEVKVGTPPNYSNQQTSIEDADSFTGSAVSGSSAKAASGGGNLRKYLNSDDDESVNGDSDVKIATNDWEVYRFLKFYNPFNALQNLGYSWRSKVKKKHEFQTVSYDETGKEIITDKSVDIITDLLGRVYDGDTQKAAAISVNYKSLDSNEIESSTFKLYTVDGQLGHKKEDAYQGDVNTTNGNIA
jgi:hypothetical protein